MMTYQEIFNEISNSAYNRFFKGLNYEGLQSTLVECATKIYIAQMQLEKEKLQQEYDELYECHEKLSSDWAKLKIEIRELRKKYNELLDSSNRKSNELSKELIELRKERLDLIRELEKEKCRM